MISTVASEFVEFDGVEKNRSPVLKYDVAQMQVAMAAAHLALPFPRMQQRRARCESGHEARTQRRDRGRRENIRGSGKPIECIFDPAEEHFRRSACALRRMFMRGDDDFGEARGNTEIEFAPLGQTIKRLRLVEPAHVDRPFDDRAFRASKAKSARVAPDRHRAEIEIRRIGAIDGDFVFASSAALFEGRKIHEREENGALDLVDIATSKKNHRAVRIDAFYRRAIKPVSRRIAEKGEDLVLILGHFVVHDSALRWTPGPAAVTSRP